jgi:hypothetical protein
MINAFLGENMTAAIRATALILLLAAPVVLSTATRAQLNPTPCTSTAQCPDGLSCQPGFFGLKFCLFEYCNTDSTCTRPGALCTLGICRLPAGVGGGGGSVGLGQSPVGGRCGPRKLGGGVIKSVGCQRGLHCINGFCEQLR